MLITISQVLYILKSGNVILVYFFASALKCRDAVLEATMHAWWYVSRARAMMHDDAYRARALALASRLARHKLYSTKDKQTGSGSQSLRGNSTP